MGWTVENRAGVESGADCSPYLNLNNVRAITGSIGNIWRTLTFTFLADRSQMVRQHHGALDEPY